MIMKITPAPLPTPSSDTQFRMQEPVSKRLSWAKYFMILLASGFLMSCAGQGDRQTQESSAEVQLEAELEEALEKNIELNERIAELEAELEELTVVD